MNGVKVIEKDKGFIIHFIPSGSVKSLCKRVSKKGEEVREVDNGYLITCRQCLDAYFDSDLIEELKEALDA